MRQWMWGLVAGLCVTLLWGEVAIAGVSGKIHIRGVVEARSELSGDATAQIHVNQHTKQTVRIAGLKAISNDAHSDLQLVLGEKQYISSIEQSIKTQVNTDLIISDADLSRLATNGHATLQFINL